MSKIKTYLNVVPFDIIGEKIGNYLQERKYDVSYCYDKNNNSLAFIQTRGSVRIKPTDDKCFNILIEGTRENCKITINNGKWGENPIEQSNQTKLVLYDGILSGGDKSKFPIITEIHIWKFLDENI